MNVLIAKAVFARNNSAINGQYRTRSSLQVVYKRGDQMAFSFAPTMMMMTASTILLNKKRREEEEAKKKNSATKK